LQCVAVCCSVLQCVAVCFSVFQCVAVCCSVLQYAAMCCSVLQCAAVCCSMLQCVAVCCSVLSVFGVWFLAFLTKNKSPVWHSLSRVWHDSFICVTWLIHMCDMTHSYVRQEFFTCVTWLITSSLMSHSPAQKKTKQRTPKFKEINYITGVFGILFHFSLYWAMTPNQQVVCVREGVYACIHIRIHIYIPTYIYVYTYIYPHTYILT